MCTFTNIQNYILLKLVALEHPGRSLIKYIFYPVVQTHTKFILANAMREGFAFSCLTVVCFPFLQKLSSGFALKLSSLPVLTRLWRFCHWMPMSSLMSAPALAVWKHHCPCRVAGGMWSCKRPSCGCPCSLEWIFSDVWFPRKQSLPLCRALCASALHRQGVWAEQRIVPTSQLEWGNTCTRNDKVPANSELHSGIWLRLVLDPDPSPWAALAAGTRPLF